LAALQSLLQPLLNAATPQTITIRTRSFINAALDWAGCSDVSRCHIGVPTAEIGRSDFLAKSDYVATPLPAAGIQVMIQKVAQRQNDPALGGGSILMDAYGGAINRVPKEATAFVHRDQLFSIQYVAASSSAADADWLRAFRGAMSPYVSGQAYQNYIDPELEHPNIAYYTTNLGGCGRLRLATTRRTCSDFLGAFCPLSPEPRPDQVTVREQEAECEQRQRGEAAEPAPDCECERRAEGQRQ
jgi:hypothetical protein